MPGATTGRNEVKIKKTGAKPSVSTFRLPSHFSFQRFSVSAFA
jgi:hypothetical protein